MSSTTRGTPMTDELPPLDVILSEEAEAIVLAWGRTAVAAERAKHVAVPVAEPRKVFLVATGDVSQNKQELYERYDDAPPPLCDAELLYSSPPVAPVASEEVEAMCECVDNNASAGNIPQWFAEDVNALIRKLDAERKAVAPVASEPLVWLNPTDIEILRKQNRYPHPADVPLYAHPPIAAVSVAEPVACPTCGKMCESWLYRQRTTAQTSVSPIPSAPASPCHLDKK